MLFWKHQFKYNIGGVRAKTPYGKKKAENECMPKKWKSGVLYQAFGWVSLGCTSLSPPGSLGGWCAPAKRVVWPSRCWARPVHGCVQIIHKEALLCPVSETKLWGELQNTTDLVPSVRDWREETLGMKISTIQTKQTRENSVTQKPQITWST